MPSDSLIARHSWTGGSANTTLFWVGYLWHCGKACANAFTSLVTYMSGLACIHVQVHKPHVLWVLDLNLHSSTSKSNKLSKWAKSRAIAWMHITHTHTKVESTRFPMSSWWGLGWFARLQSQFCSHMEPACSKATASGFLWIMSCNHFVCNYLVLQSRGAGLFLLQFHDAPRCFSIYRCF